MQTYASLPPRVGIARSVRERKPPKKSPGIAARARRQGKPKR